MVSPSSVSGVLVTRGDVDTKQIIDSWPFEDCLVWDNSVDGDLKVYGRYAMMEAARNDLVFVQDDDCYVPVRQLLRTYEGDGILLNIPPDEKALVGWGAIIDRRIAREALNTYMTRWPRDDTFLRCCDVIVTALNAFGRVDLGHEDLPWATNPDRMYHQAGHYEEREEVRRRCLTL